jgi:hypothetical protein
LQTGNRKQQRTNTNVNLATKPTHQWGTTEAQFQSQLQNPKRANCNNNNKQQQQQKTRNQSTSNEQASTSEPVTPPKNNIAHIHCRQHCRRKKKKKKKIDENVLQQAC